MKYRATCIYIDVRVDGTSRYSYCIEGRCHLLHDKVIRQERGGPEWGGRIKNYLVDRIYVCSCDKSCERPYSENPGIKIAGHDTIFDSCSTYDPRYGLLIDAYLDDPAAISKEAILDKIQLEY